LFCEARGMSKQKQFRKKGNQMNKIKQLIQKLEREKEPIDKLMYLNQINKELELIKKDLLKKIK